MLTLAKNHFKTINYFNLWMTFLLLGFIVFQPLSKTDTGNFAIGIWLTGLISLLFKPEFRSVSKTEAYMLSASIAFFAICLLSMYFSVQALTDINHLKNVFPFLIFPLTYLVFSKSNVNEKNLLIIFIIGSISYLILVLEFKPGRLSGKENAVTFGNAAFLFFVVTSYLSIINKNFLLKILGFVSAAIYFYASLQSGTRGSYLAIPFIFLFVFFTSNKKIKFLSLIALIALLVIFSQTNVYKRLNSSATLFFNYYFTEQEAKTSFSGLERIKMWRVAWCYFKQSPAFGVGHNEFKNALKTNLKGCKTQKLGANYFQAHSVYFNTLATKGLLGILCLAIFFIYTVKTAKENNNVSFPLLLIVLITILSYGLTVDLFFEKFLTERHLIIIALALAISPTIPKNRINNEQ